MMDEANEDMTSGEGLVLAGKSIYIDQKPQYRHFRSRNYCLTMSRL